MRPRAGLVVFLPFLAVLLRESPAQATDCSGVLSHCIDDDSLWPHAGPSDFVAIGGAETTAAHQLGFGLVTSYLSRPLILHLPSPGNGSDQYIINDQVNGTFLWSYGVTSRLELDMALPLTFGQSGDGLAPLTGGFGLHDTAVRDFRFGFTYAILPRFRPATDPAPARQSTGAGAAGPPVGSDTSSFGLAARFEVAAPTGDRDQFAGERSGVFAPSLAADYRFDRFFAGAEVGARIRPTTELLGAEVGTQIVTSLGFGIDILPKGLLSATIEGLALPVVVAQNQLTLQNGTLVNQPSSQSLVPSEWQLSARTSPLAQGQLAIQFAGGGGLDSSELTPRYRFTLSIRWTPVSGRDRGPVPPPARAPSENSPPVGVSLPPEAPPPPERPADTPGETPAHPPPLPPSATPAPNTPPNVH
jgi:OOP family OmpA-OmpF porin